MADPAPHPEPRPYAPHLWSVGRRIALPTPLRSLPSIDVVLASRRSARTFGALPLEDLGALLWHTLHTQDAASSPLGFELERRPTPSAGAIHPVHVLVQRPNEGWARYCSRTHVLEELSHPGIACEELVARAASLVPRGDATLLAFVAEPGKTAAKYAHGESLVWRDAGVLQGIVAIAAEALELNFSLLGITGEPWASALGESSQLMGTGLAWVGARG